MNENIKAKKRNNEKVYLTEANINKLKGLDKERKYFDTNRAASFLLKIFNNLFKIPRSLVL